MAVANMIMISLMVLAQLPSAERTTSHLPGIAWFGCPRKGIRLTRASLREGHQPNGGFLLAQGAADFLRPKASWHDYAPAGPQYARPEDRAGALPCGTYDLRERRLVRPRLGLMSTAGCLMGGNDLALMGQKVLIYRLAGRRRVPGSWLRWTQMPQMRAITD